MSYDVSAESDLQAIATMLLAGVRKRGAGRKAAVIVFWRALVVALDALSPDEKTAARDQIVADLRSRQ